MKGKPMKTYIFTYSKKTRAGYWRDYSKAVETDNLIQYAKDKLCIRDIFLSAVEVVKSEVCGYRFVEVHGENTTIMTTRKMP